MTIAIVILMLLGYLLICTEHITRINKATVALFCGVWGWVLYVCVGPYYIETLHEAGFQEFLGTKDYSIATVNEYILLPKSRPISSPSSPASSCIC